MHSEYAHLDDVQGPQASHYLTLLKAARRAKVERSGNEDVQLSREEIQAVVNKANAQTVEAVECEYEPLCMDVCM